MSSLVRRVARAIRTRDLWSADDRIAVALSGGADSVAAVLLLRELAAVSDWALRGVIHVHHGLRGDEADQDETFCRDFAARLQLPIDVVAVDVRAAITAGRRSLEAAARALRYDAFEAAAARLGATVVVTGHTADDQAETVMLRLLRGATGRGVSAIRSRRGPYARPLLECRRSELRAWLAGRAVAWREDSSNAAVDVPRNRLRQELMPVIEQAWPGGVRALARFAEMAADDERWLERQARREGPSVIRTADDGVELIRAALAALPAPLARRVVRQAIELAGGTVVFADVERIRRLAAEGRDGGGWDLHGLRVDRIGDRLRLGRPVHPTTPVPFAYRLDVPGEVRIIETGGLLRASLTSGPDRPGSIPGWNAVAALQASTVQLPLTVRSRLPGDRFVPLGAPGHRTLQDIFVDRKVPRAERWAVPVVVDASGRIVWVASVAVAEHCRVQAGESGMVILQFKKDMP